MLQFEDKNLYYIAGSNPIAYVPRLLKRVSAAFVVLVVALVPSPVLEFDLGPFFACPTFSFIIFFSLTDGVDAKSSGPRRRSGFTAALKARSRAACALFSRDGRTRATGGFNISGLRRLNSFVIASQALLAANFEAHCSLKLGLCCYCHSPNSSAFPSLSTLQRDRY